MPKDACYKKVKAKYRVFPSAYASGAIAKCRKVGAANWGNKSKKKRLLVKRNQVQILNDGLKRIGLMYVLVNLVVEQRAKKEAHLTVDPVNVYLVKQ